MLLEERLLYEYLNIRKEHRKVLVKTADVIIGILEEIIHRQHM